MSAKTVKVILLTGVTRGLGRALLDEFARHGHTVLGCGRSADGIAQLSRAFGKPHDFQNLDVADDAQIQAWAKRILPHYGAPDLIINNAALINRNALLWQVPAAEFSTVIDTNIKGVANVIRHFVPAMVAAERGIIVNLSSGWGRSTSPEVAPYCATKWAIEGLTQSLAQELPAGMAAIPLSPGVVNTDMLQSTLAGAAANYQSPAQWAKIAAPFILKLGPSDNGKPMSIT
jgi:NAD(P)-dependent dehydrogenase (short-subunit alcohol dehydrogenase family)